MYEAQEAWCRHPHKQCNIPQQQDMNQRASEELIAVTRAMQRKSGYQCSALQTLVLKTGGARHEQESNGKPKQLKSIHCCRRTRTAGFGQSAVADPRDAAIPLRATNQERMCRVYTSEFSMYLMINTQQEFGAVSSQCRIGHCRRAIC